MMFFSGYLGEKWENWGKNIYVELLFVVLNGTTGKWDGLNFASRLAMGFI